MTRERKSVVGWFAELRNSAERLKIGSLDEATKMLHQAALAANPGRTWREEDRSQARRDLTEICKRFAAMSSVVSRADPKHPSSKGGVVTPSRDEMTKRLKALEGAAQNLVIALSDMTGGAIAALDHSDHDLGISAFYAVPFCLNRQETSSDAIVTSLRDLAGSLKRQAAAAARAMPRSKGGRGIKKDESLNVLDAAARGLSAALNGLDEASGEWFLAVPPMPFGPGLFRSPGAPGPTKQQCERYAVLRLFRQRAADLSRPWPRVTIDEIVAGLLNISEAIHFLASAATSDLAEVFGEDRGGYASNIAYHLGGNPLEQLAAECIDLYQVYSSGIAEADPFWRPPRAEDGAFPPLRRVDDSEPKRLTRAVYRAAKRLTAGSAVPESVDLAFRRAARQHDKWIEMVAARYEAARRGR